MFMIFILFPFFNFIVIWFLDLLLGTRKALLLVSHLYVFFFIIISVFTFYCVNDTYFWTLGLWVNCGFFLVNWGFLFDNLSLSMLFMVCFVSGGVHFYSIGYMSEDVSKVRFLSYLSLFTFFMFLLVTSDNFIQLFLGWEGIGLCSFLLIGFWNGRVQALKAAIKAIVLNRFGDFGFLFALVLIFYFFRSVDFATVFVLGPFFNAVHLFWDISVLNWICFFLFIGAVGKSAQIGLHTWLPDAMEGPTPVSALIHAATLVTAGVFLIIRCSPIFEFASSVLFIVLIIGGVTSLFAATIAITQFDIKKVIAYSTCSQLGYMVCICGLSAYQASIFHLVNHAFFKAILFLGAGSIIHALSGDQDLRRYGQLTNLLPFTYVSILIGTIALAGLPFLSGFFSKDFILEIAYSNYTVLGSFIYWVGTLAAILTAFYSFRVLVYTFYISFTGYKQYLYRLHELPFNMAFSLFILSLGSLFSGFFLFDFFIGFGSVFWGNSIFILSKHSVHLDPEYASFLFKNLPLVFSLLSIFFALSFNYVILVLLRLGYFNCFLVNINRMFFVIFRFLSHKWYFDNIYNFYIGGFFFKAGLLLFYKLVDKGFLEVYGPLGLFNSIAGLSLVLSKRQSGYVYDYMSLLVFCSFFIVLVISLCF